jgi:predicted RNA binding protein YcfA (HicA-like mRNA interferase family)
VPAHGKGSHGTLYLGERGRTTVKDLKKELPTGTLRAMCAQLFIDPKDF